MLKLNYIYALVDKYIKQLYFSNQIVYQERYDPFLIQSVILQTTRPLLISEGYNTISKKKLEKEASNNKFIMWWDNEFAKERRTRPNAV